MHTFLSTVRSFCRFDAAVGQLPILTANEDGLNTLIGYR